jgi:hypothetical protein
MKSLKHFILESIHTYNYKIKVAGEIEETKLELLKHNLQKFSPVKITGPKTTPIQKNPEGFEGVQNEAVTIIEMECRYPVIEPYVKQIAQLLGVDPNKVRMQGTDYCDSLDKEAEGYAEQAANSPLLDNEMLEEQPGAKEASEKYGNSYLDYVKEQTKDDKMDLVFDGEETKIDFDPFKPETLTKTMGTKSPMTDVKLPPKPKTGRAGS